MYSTPDFLNYCWPVGGLPWCPLRTWTLNSQVNVKESVSLCGVSLYIFLPYGSLTRVSNPSAAGLIVCSRIRVVTDLGWSAHIDKTARISALRVFFHLTSFQEYKVYYDVIWDEAHTTVVWSTEMKCFFIIANIIRFYKVILVVCLYF